MKNLVGSLIVGFFCLQPALAQEEGGATGHERASGQVDVRSEMTNPALEYNTHNSGFTLSQEEKYGPDRRPSPVRRCRRA